MSREDKVDGQTDAALATALDAFANAALEGPVPSTILSLAAELQRKLEAQLRHAKNPAAAPAKTRS